VPQEKACRTLELTYLPGLDESRKIALAPAALIPTRGRARPPRCV